MKVAFPVGAKICGAWLQPNPAAPGASATTHHQDFWLLWDWEGWVKPQIDYCISIGINTFAVIGDLYGVANGTLNAATYRSQQLQIANYLANKGAYYMPCCANATPYTNYGLSVDSFVSLSMDILRPLQAVGNCIGVSVIDEPNSGSFTVQYVSDVMAGIRNSGCTIPRSCGLVYSQTAWIDGIEPASDFYNIHTATFPATATLLDAWLLGSTKDVLIGTTFKNQEATAGLGGGSPATVVADLKTVYDLAYSGNPRVRGILQWGAADYGNDALFPANPPHYKWGLFDTSSVNGVFNARQHKTNQIMSYSRGSLAMSKTV